MSIELMDFQEDYVEILIDRLKRAKRHIQLGEKQAVLLAAPTGSGKTVMLTALIENVLKGSTTFEAEPEACFLWLSDQPELNIQTRDKICAASTKLRESDLIILDSDFDEKHFDSGKVYFLNIQKLSKDSRLTTKGDSRAWSIWETINNSQRHFGEKFYLILDEAHRGMNRSARTESESMTIVQKFILGSDEVSALPLVVGMSATPERFERLISKSDRHLYKVQVEMNRVRDSGLLKDDLVLWMPEESGKNSWSLLKAAILRWKEMKDLWGEYCATERISPIVPAIVIQVENSSQSSVTKTDLEAVLSTIEEAVGKIQPGELVHCFDEHEAIKIGSYFVQYLEPSKIQTDLNAKFVLFKMALSTGWDCPRAEVMMSFRKVDDATLIAQLIGRMIRTPLARRIERSEVLNTVHLYLPAYNHKNIDAVIKSLKDPEMTPTTEVQLGDRLRELKLGENFSAEYTALNGLPTYQVKSLGKMHDIRRLIKFASLLTIVDELDEEALSSSRKAVVNDLLKWKKKLSDEKDFKGAYAEANRVRVRPLVLDHNFDSRSGDEQFIDLSERGIEDLYRNSKQRIGDDICIEFLRTSADREQLSTSKVELYLLLQNQQVWDSLQKTAEQEIRRLKQKHQSQIRALPLSHQARYEQLWARARNLEAISLQIPKVISAAIEEEEVVYQKHLYVDDSGEFKTKLNSWERKVINTEIPTCHAWLRNSDRKSWSIAYPYQLNGEWKAGYPDFIVLRKDGTQLVVDLLEPHASFLSDSPGKVKGLAIFADKHGSHFGRIEVERVDGGVIQRLDLQNAHLRERAMKINNVDDLNNLFLSLPT